MDDYMRSLVNAPLADAAKLYSPGGRRTIKRGPKPEYHGDEGTPKLTGKQVRERRDSAASAKQAAVLDYYAGTTIPFDRIAEHVGLWRMEQTGTDDDGKPILTRALDVERVRQEMACRGRAA